MKAIVRYVLAAGLLMAGSAMAAVALSPEVQKKVDAEKAEAAAKQAAWEKMTPLEKKAAQEAAIEAAADAKRSPEEKKMRADAELKKRWYFEMPEIAKKNNCTPCHAVYKRFVGPAWLDISKKYKGVAKFTYNGQEYPLQEGLMMKVSKGGAGSWGAMPMPPIDAAGAKQADIKEMVSFIIGLEKADDEKKAAKKKYDAEQAAAKKK